ncbi:MAG: ribosome biogenesis GTPase Der [Firmicutes bacterium]|nr:ribosome biogenesis GTPase Der [Bacillota bacterium]MCM1393616.1 ribosome biogenesis GTPase Der [[Eubacterium] siraeum]
MMKPLIAVVGRPNVGKSTLFNRIVGDRIAIVEDTPGVTRDRIYADCEWCGRAFTLIDTGGLELKSDDEMWTHIRTQAEIAVDTANAILYVVDGKTGLTNDDNLVCSFLRKSKLPVVLAVNKIDNNYMDSLYDFYALGFGEPYPVSAEQGKGIGDLLDALMEVIPVSVPEDDPERIKIAIVGKPNAGKSSITNRLLGYDRCIVSDVAGTTRDAIDTELNVGDDKYLIIDTAGMRKKRAVEQDLERYSVMRALLAVRRADVVLMVCDANEGFTEQDVKIAGYVHEEDKPSVIVMNKWDLIDKDTHTIYEFEKKLKEDLKYMSYFKSVYVSAKSGKRLDNLLPLCKEVVENSRRRISTGLLNEVIGEAIRISEPPSYLGKKLKVYFVTQVGVAPPSFVVKVNEPSIMHFSYKRYLENALRKSFDFSGTPIRIMIRANGEKD